MCNIRVVTYEEECRELWERVMPGAVITDLWETRACVHRHFQRRPRFIVAEAGGEIRGLLPLSEVRESGRLSYFPGETWEGKTWLEQNRIYAADAEVETALLARVEEPLHLRYLVRSAGVEPPCSTQIDEVGYLFDPPAYGFDIDNYFGEFSRKSAKRIRREISDLESRGVSFRHDDPVDFDVLVELNLQRFGERSYFADGRFRAGFRQLVDLLHERGWLRVTTVLIDGQVAAVDVGSVFRGTYTVLAGGTHAGFPGIAKLINVHHMRWACQQRLREVDFLCGDFSWKKLFHLRARPLYLLARSAVPLEHAIGPGERGVLQVA